MYTLGVDAGIDFTKAAVACSDGTYAGAVVRNGLDPTAKSVAAAAAKAIEAAGIEPNEICDCAITGIAAEDAGLDARVLPAFLCLAKGANHLIPAHQTVVDLGSRRTLALSCKDGIAIKTSASEKCASGAGAFLNTAATFLGIDLTAMNAMYFEADEGVTFETKCAVFLESEIISLIHRKVPAERIVRGVFEGLARRVTPLLLGLPSTDVIQVTGGGARLSACVDALQSALGHSVSIHDDGQLAGAIGAALIAADKAAKEMASC